MQPRSAPAVSQAAAPLAGIAGAPPVQQVERLLDAAVRLGASDVHLEPYEAFVRVRYRVDGALRRVGELDPRRYGAVVSRIKVLAALDIAEKRRPQDGRIRFDYRGGGAGPGAAVPGTGRDAADPPRPVDLRVSVLPTSFGEKVVLRVLDRAALRLDLGALGFEARELAAFREAIRRPHGIVLVTGPTGSGKTTTLYAALQELNGVGAGGGLAEGGLAGEGLNITTVEDPVEYDLPGVNQVQARPEIGFGFAEALRAFLRQDPDVIMVGEVRDAETALIAVRAALTGHLVLATLHTNDAVGALPRLVDMGVEPYLVAASVRAVLAQRLVRRACERCAEALERGSAGYEAARAFVAEALSEAEAEAARPVSAPGCAACGGTGFRGRSALAEVLPVDESLAEAVGKGEPVAPLREAAATTGWRPIRALAARALARGETTLEEAITV